MTDENYKQFPNIGYYQKKLNNNELLHVKNEVNSILKNFSGEKFNKNLAGNIKKEFLLSKSKKDLENLLLPLIQAYHNNSNILNHYNIMSKSLALYLDKCWVNFQEKYEFNPSHNHDGIISFVIWLQIPFYLDDEYQQSPGKESNINCSGNFEFQYVSSLGSVSSIKIHCDKTMENTVLLFPASMSHCVYPFYSSDNYRISISGNFKLLVE